MKATEKINLDSKKKYDEQVFLQFGMLSEAQKLEKKTKKTLMNPNASTIIELDNTTSPENNKYEALKNLTYQSRIYIEGHGPLGGLFIIKGDGSEEMQFEKLAEILIQNLDKKKITDPSGSSHLKISLDICHAGRSIDKDLSNCLAGKLQQKLAEHEIYVDVIARTVATSVRDDGTKITLRQGQSSQQYEENLLNLQQAINRNDFSDVMKFLKDRIRLSQHYQKGSKLLFTWDKNQPVVLDAYTGQKITSPIIPPVKDSLLGSKLAVAEIIEAHVNKYLAARGQGNLERLKLVTSIFDYIYNSSDFSKNNVIGFIEKELESHIKVGKEKTGLFGKHHFSLFNGKIKFGSVFYSEMVTALSEIKKLDFPSPVLNSPSHP